MDQWTEIRRRVLTGEITRRAACREYGVHWHTLEKMLSFVEPPGYRRKVPKPRPKIDPFLPIIHEILKSDQQVHKKQRHTSKRIFDRLREEHGFTGGITIVNEAVREWKATSKEVFLPLSHPPGEAQVDFGFAQVTIAGKTEKVALFVMTLPYSDAIGSLQLPPSLFILAMRSASSVASPGMHRSIPRRTQASLRLLRRGAEEDPLR